MSVPLPNAKQFSDALRLAITDEWLEGYQACWELVRLRDHEPSPTAPASIRSTPAESPDTGRHTRIPADGGTAK